MSATYPLCGDPWHNNESVSATIYPSCPSCDAVPTPLDGLKDNELGWESAPSDPALNDFADLITGTHPFQQQPKPPSDYNNLQGSMEANPASKLQPESHIGAECMPKTDDESSTYKVTNESEKSTYRVTDWEAERDAAAEAYAKATIGLVDPAKWYAFVAGADWAMRYAKGEKWATTKRVRW